MLRYSLRISTDPNQVRYPQTFIEDLRRQADIVRIIQDYVTLKKTGANWVARCPFHKETKPSFSVNPSKAIFYCFGCQKGGSVFNFVMEIERVTFPEAVRIVAEKSGVKLPRLVDDSRFEARKREADDVIELNRWALAWWQQQLQSKGAPAQAAREYLDSREVDEETRQTFHIGFAPDSWDALSAHLRRKGATDAQIVRSGLVVPKEGGGSYDRFRGRLIFPVLDAQGRPVAFGGRTLEPQGEPKYLNSPETPAYTKGRHLFGLHLTRDEIRRQGYAILVEGYLDLIVPYRFGVPNMVASLGTALTAEQVKLLGRFARKVVVNYDGDRAGVQAAKRAIETLLAEDFEVKVLVLPDNADPDEFIRKHGTAEYQRQRGEARPHIQFVINQAVRERDLRRPAEKAAAVEEVVPFVRAVRNRIQRREYFDIAMDGLRVQPDQRREIWQQMRTRASGPAPVQATARRTLEPTVAEERLLSLLLADEELRREVLPVLEAADHQELVTASIFSAVTELNREGAPIDFESLSLKIAEDSQSAKILPRLLMSETIDAETSEERLASAKSCLGALRLMNIDRRINELRAEIAEAQRMGDDAQSERLLVEHLEWTKRRDMLMPRAETAAKNA